MAGTNENNDASKKGRKTDTSRRLRREDESALVDVKEAARMCKISESMLYKLNSAGRMPMPIKLGTLLRWKRKEIMKWIDEGCPTGGPEKTRE